MKIRIVAKVLKSYIFGFGKFEKTNTNLTAWYETSYILRRFDSLCNSTVCITPAHDRFDDWQDMNVKVSNWCYMAPSLFINPNIITDND